MEMFSCMSAPVWGDEKKGGGGGGLMSAPGKAVSWLLPKAFEPPPTTPCGTEGGPPVTATRLRLRDGRHIAYMESGVPKGKALFKIVFCHGFSGNRTNVPGVTQELMESLGVYMVGFDRPGYAESDPCPDRTVRSTVFDVEELADALGLGPKFYLIGNSMGNYIVWGALKYIPHRIAGAALLAPVINYWWPGFPQDLAAEAYNKQELGDQWALRISHHAPAVLHWWMEQSWLPTSTVIKGTTPLVNKLDRELREASMADGSFHKRQALATQQGIYESLYRDMKIMFGKWEFDPMELAEPPCKVSLWQGDEDSLVPVMLQRHIAKRLPWIDYHELPGTGHALGAVPGLGNKVLKTLLGQAE